MVYCFSIKLAFPFYIFLLIFMYLIGCTGSQLQHVGSSSPTRDRIQATLQWELRVLAKDHHGSPKLAFLKQHYLDLPLD